MPRPWNISNDPSIKACVPAAGVRAAAHVSFASAEGTQVVGPPADPTRLSTEGRFERARFPPALRVHLFRPLPEVERASGKLFQPGAQLPLGPFSAKVPTCHGRCYPMPSLTNTVGRSISCRSGLQMDQAEPSGDGNTLGLRLPPSHSHAAGPSDSRRCLAGCCGSC